MGDAADLHEDFSFDEANRPAFERAMHSILGDNPRAVLGGNSPPDPIDTAIAPFGDAITEAEAMRAKADTVKGLRTVTLYEVTDHRALLNWIARNDRDSVTAFIDEWARENHKGNTGADGLRVWTEKQAF